MYKERDIKILKRLNDERQKKIEKRRTEIEDIHSDISCILDKIGELEEKITMCRGVVSEKETEITPIEEEIKLLEKKIMDAERLISIAETGELPEEEKKEKKLAAGKLLMPLSAFC